MPQLEQRAGWPKKPPSANGGWSLRRGFDRTWKALTRFRSKVGAARFRELMMELPSTIANIGSSDQRDVAEFFVLLGPESFSTFLTELVEALETGSDPDAFWAKWIEVVVERTRQRPTTRKTADCWLRQG